MFHAFGNNPITYTDPDGRKNKVAIVGYDNRWGVRKTFYEAAKRSGNRIVSSGIIFPIKVIGNYGAVKSGKEAISVLERSGSKNNPITDIFFSTHGAPYAIDFWNSGNNIYISEESMKSLNSSFKPGNEAAYISDIVNLVDDGIIASDANIVLGGCLNGAKPSDVPFNTKEGFKRNGKFCKSIIKSPTECDCYCEQNSGRCFQGLR